LAPCDSPPVHDRSPHGDGLPARTLLRQSVAIASEGQRALITGDFIHHPCQMARPEWCTAFDEDRQAALALRRRMLEELADSETLVIGTHFAAPTAGHVRRDAEGFRFAE
jgi:glyoxylase-like metal-dependent hydrolase (beta-lactamase superfamily II)